MIIILVLCAVLLLFFMNALMWKTGAVGESEKPTAIIDRPVMDAKEQKAITKRLRRWKEEGKLSREEFEAFYGLCKKEWDPND